MVDLGLFAVGLVGGASALVGGGPAMLAAPLVLAVVAGFWDGRTHPRLRWARSWAPALFGSLVVPVVAIVKDQFRDPPAPDAGLALSVGIAFLAAFAAAFVVTTLATSGLIRWLVRR